MPKDTKTLCIKKGCASVLTQPHRDRIDFLVSPPMEILLFDSFFIRFSNAQCFVSPDVAPGFNSLR